MKKNQINLDALGMCASALCMVHCLAFPFLLAALPMLKLSSAQTERVVAAEPAESSDVAITQVPDQCCEEDCCAEAASARDSETAACCATPTDYWIHVGLLAAVAPLGIVAWGAGYRQHQRLGVLGLGLLGVLLLSGALLFGHNLLDGRGEQVMTVLGSICLVSAHLWNRRQCRCCSKPEVAGVVEIEGSEAEAQSALSVEHAS